MLSGIVNVPRLEELFGQVMARLAQQEAEIGWLRARVERSEVSRRLESMEARLARLEKEVGNESVGRCVVENRSAIAKLADVVDAKIDGPGLAAALEGVDERISKLKSETAPLGYARSVEAMGLALSKRLRACETQLDAKLDASAAAGLEVTCARLREADGKIGSLERRIEDHEEALEAGRCSTALACLAIDAGAAAAAARAADLDAADAASVETCSALEMARRADEIERRKLEDRIARNATRADEDIKRLRDARETADRGTRAAVAAVAVNLEALAGETRTRASDLADRLAAAAAVSDANHAAAERKRHLHSRTTFDAIARRIVVLEKKSATFDHRIDIALRFVDWFASRGEAYEHNLGAIDRRLETMIPPQTRPF